MEGYAGIEATSSSSLLPPTLKAPPPLYNNTEDEVLKCRGCQSASIYVDWKAGDKVCTNCGIVYEDHVRDARPEWRVYEDDKDDAPSKARCGMVPTNESKYIGGLQPTTMSRCDYGGGAAATTASLFKTHCKIEHILDLNYKQKLKDLKLTLDIQQKHAKQDDEDDEENQQLKQEEYILVHNALVADKWSIDRALLLYGTMEEASQYNSSLMSSTTTIDIERNELMRQLDVASKTASQQVYTAYLLIIGACQALKLNLNICHESIDIVCQYIMRRDGFHVKGIKDKEEEEEGENNSKVRKKKLKLKQIAALSAAVLYVTAKTTGYAKPLVQICSSFSFHKLSSLPFDLITQSTSQEKVKPKSCSKAIAELKLEFPAMIQSLLSQSVEAVNMVEHCTSQLELPTLCVDVIRQVVKFVSKRLTNNRKKTEDIHLATLCASCTYFVCWVGEIMQRLAKQALQKNSIEREEEEEKDKLTHPKKKQKIEKTKESHSLEINTVSLVSLTNKSTTSFDVFSNPFEDSSLCQQQSPQQQGWYSWNQEVSWKRSINDIQVALQLDQKVSQQKILDFYQKNIFGNRAKILSLVQEYLVNRKLLYLVDISIVVPLLTFKKKEQKNVK